MTDEPSRGPESVTFSLRELEALEDERIAREKREREERARRELEERAERARREAEAKAAEQRRELEELARREALQRATIEQVRIDVEARARAEEREHERRHELELAKLRAEQVKAKPSGAAFAGGIAAGASIALAVALGITFGVSKPAADRQLAEAGEAVARAESRATNAERRVEEQKAVLDGLRGDLEAAQRELATLRAGAGKRTQDTTPAPSRHGPRRSGAGGTHDPAGGTGSGCLPHDPMCFDVGR